MPITLDSFLIGQIIFSLSLRNAHNKGKQHRHVGHCDRPGRCADGGRRITSRRCWQHPAAALQPGCFGSASAQAPSDLRRSLRHRRDIQRR